MPGLKARDLETHSFYDLLRSATDHDRERCPADRADGHQRGGSEALNVPLHSPAFLFERTSRAADGRIVEFVQSIYRGDRYVIVSELSPNGARGAAPVLTAQRMADGSEPRAPQSGARTSARGSSGTSPATWRTSRAAASTASCTFSENDLAYYRDTMKEIVDVSHANGLEVQMNPWGVGGRSAARRRPVRALPPDACQVLDDGRRGAAACLNHPDYRAAAATGPTRRARGRCRPDVLGRAALGRAVHVGIDDPKRSAGAAAATSAASASAASCRPS